MTPPDGAVQGAIRSCLETMTGNLGQFESDWWRPVSESSLLLTEAIHEVGAGRYSRQAHSVATSTRCFSQSSGSG